MPGRDPEITQKTPGKGMKRNTKASCQRVLIYGDKPMTLDTSVGGVGRHEERKVVREVILPTDPGQINN